MLTTVLVERIQGVYNGKVTDELTDPEKDALRNFIRQLIAEELDVDAEDISNEAAFADLGMDSISFLQVFDEMKKAIQLPIPTGELISFSRNSSITTIDEMVETMVSFLRTKGSLIPTVS